MCPSMQSENSLGGGEGEFQANDDDFRFTAVEFEEIVIHPGSKTRYKTHGSHRLSSTQP